VKDHTKAELKTYQYGDQIGTTGLAYIDQVIKPTKGPRVFNSLANAASALETHQIDAIVLDTPDGQYMASSGSGEVINAKKQNHRDPGGSVSQRGRALRPSLSKGQTNWWVA